MVNETYRDFTKSTTEELASELIFLNKVCNTFTEARGYLAEARQRESLDKTDDANKYLLHCRENILHTLRERFIEEFGAEFFSEHQKDCIFDQSYFTDWYETIATEHDASNKRAKLHTWIGYLVKNAKPKETVI